MGQVITITGTTIVGDAAIFDSDRSISGQDGSGYPSAAEAADDTNFPGRLAGAIFASDAAVSHVHVASNSVVVKREGGWDDAATSTTAAVIRDFFVYYDD